MDQLKTLRPFTWTAVEAQAEELANLITSAQKQWSNSVEYSGEIHPVNREILKSNGFSVYSENGGQSFTIAWTRFVNESTASCQCDPCCCTDTSTQDTADSAKSKDDELKKFLTFVLSSIASPSAPAAPQQK
jgi:hypothetical protein